MSDELKDDASMKAMQQMIHETYPFERDLPENCQDPDVVMDHIMKMSFLSNRKTLNQQAKMQAAEEYAMQVCQIRCKRDGRMKREREENDGQMRISPAQLLAKMEKEMTEKGMTKQERQRLERTKAFHAALEAVPWTELNEPEVAQHVPKVVDDGKPKSFLSKSLFSAPRELTPAEEAELKYDVDRGVATIEGEDDDVDDKIASLSTSSSAVASSDSHADSATMTTTKLTPAIPKDAVAPTISKETLALDPNNPEIVPQPIKERHNRFSYAAKFGEEFDQVVMQKDIEEEAIKQVLREKKLNYGAEWEKHDENIAGFVADGSVVPVFNEGPLARADLPSVYARDGPNHRAKVMAEKYNPALDLPFTWNPKFRYIVVSMIGPDCPQKAPRRLFRIWGGVKSEKEGKHLMEAIVKNNPYGYLWKTYIYSIQRWIAFPPKGKKEDKGTVMEGNNEFAEYQQAFFDHEKQKTIELEQRALDSKAGEKTAGQSIIQQLKQKNMHVPGGVDPSMIPRR